MKLLILAFATVLLLGCASQGGVQSQGGAPNATLNNAAGGTGAQNGPAETENSSNFTLHVMYFYGSTCPYSARTTPTVNALNASYSAKRVAFHYYEIWNSTENAVLYNKLAEVYGIAPEKRGVPLVIIDGEYFMSYQRINQYLEQEINACLAAKCPNPLDALTNASIAIPI